MLEVLEARECSVLYSIVIDLGEWWKLSAEQGRFNWGINSFARPETNSRGR